MPGDGKNPEGWSSPEKFRVVLESASLSEVELSECCRGKGLSVEQVRDWRAACEQANATAHASLAPHQIVPRLADEGVYVASESTFYRVLKAAGQQHGRGRARRPSRRVVTTHCAEGPNQVWCWDITWLPTTVRGQFLYWYMMKDIHSRKRVANEVHASEAAVHAAALVVRGCLREGLAGRPLVLHSDNGAAMKGSTMLAAMQNLGVMPSFSRPRVLPHCKSSVLFEIYRQMGTFQPALTCAVAVFVDVARHDSS